MSRTRVMLWRVSTPAGHTLFTSEVIYTPFTGKNREKFRKFLYFPQNVPIFFFSNWAKRRK